MNWSLRSRDEVVIKNPNQIKLHVHMILRSRVEPTVHLHVLSEPFTCENQVKLSDERLLRHSPDISATQPYSTFARALFCFDLTPLHRTFSPTNFHSFLHTHYDRSLKHTSTTMPPKASSSGGLSEREMQLLCNYCRCMKSKPEV
jgi:hypothetical protein